MGGLRFCTLHSKAFGSLLDLAWVGPCIFKGAHNRNSVCTHWLDRRRGTHVAAVLHLDVEALREIQGHVHDRHFLHLDLGPCVRLAYGVDEDCMGAIPCVGVHLLD